MRRLQYNHKNELYDENNLIIIFPNVKKFQLVNSNDVDFSELLGFAAINCLKYYLQSVESLDRK